MRTKDRSLKSRAETPLLNASFRKTSENKKDKVLGIPPSQLRDMNIYNPNNPVLQNKSSGKAPLIIPQNQKSNICQLITLIPASFEPTRNKSNKNYADKIIKQVRSKNIVASIFRIPTKQKMENLKQLVFQTQKVKLQIKKQTVNIRPKSSTENPKCKFRNPNTENEKLELSGFRKSVNFEAPKIDQKFNETNIYEIYTNRKTERTPSSQSVLSLPLKECPVGRIEGFVSQHKKRHSQPDQINKQILAKSGFGDLKILENETNSSKLILEIKIPETAKFVGKSKVRNKLAENPKSSGAFNIVQPKSCIPVNLNFFRQKNTWISANVSITTSPFLSPTKFSQKSKSPQIFELVLAKDDSVNSELVCHSPRIIKCNKAGNSSNSIRCQNRCNSNQIRSVTETVALSKTVCLKDSSAGKSPKPAKQNWHINFVKMNYSNPKNKKTWIGKAWTRKVDSQRDLVQKIKTHISELKTIPPTTLEFYEFIKVIGEGNSGKVFLAKSVLANKLVAIKQIAKVKLIDRESKTRFIQEIEILKELRHPNIVRLFEVFETKAHVFIVTEYIDRGDLLSVLQKQGIFNESHWRKLMSQMLDCLSYLEHMHVLHRDIKLENLLLDCSDNIKLCDFGVAFRYRRHQSVRGLAGTPAYLAPEMLEGQSYAGHASDVWSLGITSFIAVTGKIPFKANGLAEMKQVILGTDPQFPVNGKVSEEFKSLISGMLRKSVATRLTVRQIAELLQVDIQVGEIKERVVLDASKLDKLKAFGFPKYLVRAELKNGLLSHVNALYSLI